MRTKIVMLRSSIPSTFLPFPSSPPRIELFFSILSIHHYFCTPQRKYQNTSDLLIRRLPFQRLVREICENERPNLNDVATPLRFRRDALEALQVAAEAYLTDLFADASLATVHGEFPSLLGLLFVQRRKPRT